MPTRSLLVAVALLAGTSPSFAQDKGRKVAFLVGVGKFKFDLADLGGSPQKDVTELKKVLEAHKYDVAVLTDERATKDAIEKRFAAVLGGDGDPARALGKGDVLLVALCTHGFTLQPGGGKPAEPFVAGYDGKPTDPNTLVRLNGLIDAPKGTGATCLFLIDACREEPDPNRGTRGIEPTRASLPKGTAVLFACSQGQLSHQHEKAGGHGLFTYAVLKTLKGEGTLKGKVSWTGLAAAVEQAFDSDEFKAMLPPARGQTPVLAQGELVSPTLVTLGGGRGGGGAVGLKDKPKDGSLDKKQPPPPPGKASLKVTVTKVYRDDRTDDFLTSVDSIPKGTAVEVIEVRGDRARVKWSGGTGWVNKDAVDFPDK